MRPRHHSHRDANPRAILFLILTTIAGPLGCNGQPSAAGLPLAISQYEAGRYREAFEAAVRTQRAASDPERSSAAYVAGLAAYHLNQPDEAERRFLIARQSPDSQTRGRAEAMLGTIRSEQDRPLDAAEHFKSASRLLTGREANEAAYRAGLAYQQGGDPASARTQFTIAGSSTSASHSASGGGGGGDLRARANEQLARTGFTIQVGAFRDRENAEAAAREAQPIADRHGLGEVRIIPQADPRSTRAQGNPAVLYLVQFGQFGTRSRADTMRQQIGNLRWIVTRAD